MWTYKTYFAGDTEYFEYSAQGYTGEAATGRMYPFLESLLQFLEMDIPLLKPMVDGICESWDCYFETGDNTKSRHAMALIGELEQQHIYLKLVALHWFTWRDKQLCTSEKVNELRLLPEQLVAYQKQAQQYIGCVLDIDKVGRETQKNASANPKAFDFQPIPVSFGQVELHACGGVLHPNSIRDIIDFTLRECVTRGVPLRRCKNCGRYFPLLGRVTAEYCSRPNGNKKACRDTGAALVWTKAQDDNTSFREYRREYKRRFAWRKAGKITEEEFSVWCEAARAKKKECDDNRISLDAFKMWLRDSKF